MKIDWLLECIDIVEEKNIKPKQKDAAKKDRPMDQTAHRLKNVRGDTRKHHYQVTKANRPTHDNLKFAKNIVGYAKKARAGVWKVSPIQAEEIANKYDFYLPNPNKRSKHLGSTGILLWLNPKNNKYYLYKPKHRDI